MSEHVPVWELLASCIVFAFLADTLDAMYVRNWDDPRKHMQVLAIQYRIGAVTMWIAATGAAATLIFLCVTWLW